MALGAALLGVACGGGGSSSSTTPTAPTAPSGSTSTKLVVLDAGNFDAVVLAGPRPSLVKFQSPT